MSIRLRPFRTGGWEVDIHALQADGTVIRERRLAPVTSRSAAERWAQARAQELALNGRRRPEPESPPAPEVPTLAEFAPRFLADHAQANRQKPSGVAAKETILRVHLLPPLGSRRLDEITSQDVARLKGQLRGKSPKTVNNVLTVLGKLLKVAASWGVIERVPCTVEMVKLPRDTHTFHDFEEYARLIEGARRVGPDAELIVLLGGDAGLRCGEMMALEWSAVDLSRRQLHVIRSEWKGQVTAPKGNRPRMVPMTSRLAEALGRRRHVRGRRVLAAQDGHGYTQKMVRNRVLAAAQMVALSDGRVHTLRHTFCSHLAMRGVPARAIQELAGHADLATTLRYMHLSPSAIEEAIRLLETAPSGDSLETWRRRAPQSP